MTADTPSREELIASIAGTLEGHSFALRAGAHHEEVATKIVDRILARLAANPADDDVREALDALSGWCAQERSGIGAVDGYDYRSGEEFGIRRVEIEIEKRICALPTKATP
jgi:hypothetical protein